MSNCCICHFENCNAFSYVALLVQKYQSYNIFVKRVLLTKMLDFFSGFANFGKGNFKFSTVNYCIFDKNEIVTFFHGLSNLKCHVATGSHVSAYLRHTFFVGLLIIVLLFLLTVHKLSLMHMYDALCLVTCIL
jgi:hypothetical protein